MKRDQIRGPRIRQGRFTLLEVIAVIAVLTFGILSIASMQVGAIYGKTLSDGTTEAITWAEDHLEKLMLLPWDDPMLVDTDGDGVHGLNDIDLDHNPGTQANSDQGLGTQGQYRVFWNVADHGVVHDTKTVQVIVTWTDGGLQRRVALQRVIPRTR